MGPAAFAVNPVAAIGTAASVGGQYANYRGTQQTNEANERIARARNAMEVEEALKARTFSAAEAQRSRDWQADMSNTAVQRAMADMKKAGINPALAGSQPASSPAGATASTAKANAHGYTAQNALAAFKDTAASALSLQRGIAEIDNIKAQTELTRNKGEMTDPVAQLAGVLGRWLEPATSDAKSVNMYDKAKDSVKNALTVAAQVGESTAKKAGDYADKASSTWDDIKKSVSNSVKKWFSSDYWQKKYKTDKKREVSK